MPKVMQKGGGRSSSKFRLVGWGTAGQRKGTSTRSSHPGATLLPTDQSPPTSATKVPKPVKILSWP